MKSSQPSNNDAQILALQAVEFLAMEEGRLTRFLQITGTSPNELAQELAKPAFQGGVLDYLLNDETLLFQFCEFAQIAAESPAAARRFLP